MKTKITQKIDDYNIIIGIGEAQIDPVKSNPIAIEELKKTVEYKAVEDKKKELQPLAVKSQQAFKNAKASKTVSEKNGFVKEYQQVNEQIKIIESQLKELFMPLTIKQSELILKHAVYFQPKEGEFIIDDVEALAVETAMQQAAQANKLLDDTLKQISDYRGETVWKKISGKWQQRAILKIGDEPKAGEILASALTENQQSEIKEQLNAERIAGLNSAAKIAEKTAMIDNAMSQAVSMRSSLEIAGDNQALKKSQDWYNTEVERINALYV